MILSLLRRDLELLISFLLETFAFSWQLDAIKNRHL